MVHNKFSHEVVCNLTPDLEGPSLFVAIMEIEMSDDSNAIKNRKKRQIENYFKRIESKNKFNQWFYWLPRKLESIYWKMVS